MTCWSHLIFYKGYELSLFRDFTYFIRIKRRPLYLLTNIVIPTFLFSILSCAVFYLPADSGEKMTLCISILLSLAVFLMGIINAIPSTATNVPLLAKYVLFTTVLVSVSVALTVVVQNIHHRGPTTHEMPKWMRLIFIKYMPKIIPSASIRVLDYKGPVPPAFSTQDKSDFPTDERIKQALEGVEYMAKTTQMNDYDDALENEWKYVAMVIDHFLLYFFIILVTVMTTYYFSPYVNDMMHPKGLNGFDL